MNANNVLAVQTFDHGKLSSSYNEGGGQELAESDGVVLCRADPVEDHQEGL